jgi:glycosyltransferase involved in cell wall biosynthesis
MWDYPSLMRRRRKEFDLFHLVDHSYSQLVHRLPRERTVVTCHDLDTFRCVLEPERDRRSPLFRAMARYIMHGLTRAAQVVCVSEAVRTELLAWELVDPERVSVVANGVHPACSDAPDPAADAIAERLLGPATGEGTDLLHVGSTIARKRIDLLLRIVAAVRERHSEVRLIRVGGAFTPEQQRLARDLDVADAVVTLPFLERPVLAAVYRRAALVLQPSEREGFGLPVAEAMACGTPVVASDLPVLREVGGDAAEYCEVGDVAGWADAVDRLLRERCESPAAWRARRGSGLRRAGAFTWSEHARRMVKIYERVLCS